MSTLSVFERDQTNRLAKRFAGLATSYFDEPQEGRKPAARIPLENLFRIIEMFRYGAFSDEPRRGVLELEPFTPKTTMVGLEGAWHDKIEGALNTALADAFGAIPKDDALREVQSVLTWLATDGAMPPQDTIARSRAFLQRFEGALP